MNNTIKELLTVILGTFILAFGGFIYLLFLTNMELRLLYLVIFIGMFIAYWYGRLWTFIWKKEEREK